ncbi:ABC transporter ATP-binding protein [Rhodococcus sp. BP-252]|uniref:ABC transporter ATP-binding protein n=1 Tax=Rhodococcus sp. B10 TaxID=2695876 RepID=UPI000B2EC3C3|nr:MULTISPECIES: ABC transporter ATP-binding protein [Rhodococcus]NIL76534.1 Daunorubicin/doxorubicin resistance ATP-binding protein DrrA [Rhodococcus sp. B10]MBY6409996.1 ABC transporter ATP-binding protein [Rhodococcus sp. BP-320]MBY6414965.1 ABC transporter ATP-binding protein [Rhodococcus sp. BP-321]MBY6421332.1 ABC transporter ATP-binding protein [Rhodococcus sp. BP-324]MBY6425727.1 ABC transporter ATP-binding protein [Rhodococcus sp. BP-323]
MIVRSSNSSTQPAVQLTDVRKSYNGLLAVDGLDITVERGQVLALLGPNGAGKTTTVEMCEGFVTPDSGTVRVLGLDPITQSAQLRPRIGVMLQGGGAYPGAKAGEMLHLVASYSANPLDPDWLLTCLGLDRTVKTPYRRLSGGQQQRLALACAIVGRPELVFLDEPTAGLDAQARLLVWELVEALRRDGVSVLLTTHLMDEAEQLADQLVIVDHGRIVASGTASELTKQGAEGRLRFTAPPGLELSLLDAALPVGYRPSEESPGSYVIEGVIEPDILVTVTSWCAQQNVLATELQVDQRRLEDVFLELTGRELRR